MGPERSSLGDGDRDGDEDAVHQDRVLNDLTIIQAQAQLMMRRIEAKRDVEHYDVYQRLSVVVDAVRRLTELHRKG